MRFDLTQNGKMAKSGGGTYWIWNWGITAYAAEVNGRKFVTCPWAGTCGKEGGCYALQGSYTWDKVAKAYYDRLLGTLDESFVEKMSESIAAKVNSRARKGRTVAIRIHDSGDFYNGKYLAKWIEIMERFPEVEFYAYTKAISLMHLFEINGRLPGNFTVIASEGGTEAVPAGLRHSRVFESHEALVAAGYDDATSDDSVAFTSKSGKIGLVYHGYKSKAWETAS